jgi:alkylation response protein AidB-like acyl-CoA dehydrogenase
MTTSAETRPKKPPTGRRPRSPEADIVERIRTIQRLLEKNSDDGEAARRVVEESITALTDVGAFKIAQPRRYGGYETSVRTMLDVSSAVAEADGGTAWVVTLCNVCAWLTSLFPERAQDDVWATNPDAKVSGVLAPTAESTQVDGGVRVSGRWYHSPGSWHADWAVLGFPISDTRGEIADHGFALIARDDLELEETWFVAGMKSSGSNCLIASDVYVPDHRVLSMTGAIYGDYRSEHTDVPLYRSALIPVLALALAGPQLGLGRRALQLVKEHAAHKPVSYTYYSAQSDSVAFQLQIAEAAMLIDTAHLHAYRAAEDIDSAARRGVYPDELGRARVRADAGWVLDHITKAIDILMSAHGGSSFAETNPLQRIWRDSAVAARDAVTMPIVNYEIYGKALLGRDDQITPLI